MLADKLAQYKTEHLNTPELQLLAWMIVSKTEARMALEEEAKSVSAITDDILDSGKDYFDKLLEVMTETLIRQAAGTKWIEVESTSVVKFGYDRIMHVLSVVYHRTGLYRYSNVPESVYNELLHAAATGESVGGLIYELVKANEHIYPYWKGGDIE
jgi:hypothetical protein